jgi:cysteine desulfurase
MKPIYLDHNATTPLHPQVRKAIQDALSLFGNPSSICRIGREARHMVERARRTISAYLGAQPEEIIFTGSGTEANNLAIKGILRAACEWKKLSPDAFHVITSQIEHPSVLETCKGLASAGVKVTFLPVDRRGRVRLRDFIAAITPSTLLASIMLANNEIGAIQPIQTLAREAHKRGVLFHCDAVQALGKIPIDSKKLGADLLTFSGHKIRGPKGVGLLWVRRGVRIRPLLDGGPQEHELRAGTENAPGIIGLGKAFEVLARKDLKASAKNMAALKEALRRGLMQRIKGVHVNSASANCLPNTLSISIDDTEAESLLMHLDLAGICVSAGSACSAESYGEVSHVLLAIGLSPDQARATLRFSLGDTTTHKQINEVVRRLPGIVAKVRSISPSYLARTRKA